MCNGGINYGKYTAIVQPVKQKAHVTLLTNFEEDFKIAMKYLHLHKLIWFLLVLFSVAFDIIIYIIYYIIYVIWNCKLPKKLWKVITYSQFDNNDDANIIDTIKRRYKFLNKIS